MGSNSNGSLSEDHKDMIDSTNSNDKNTEESMEEEIPPILSAAGREVFPLFAEMLDIKSYMTLAMANKEMYERCLTDKRIRIKIKDGEVSVKVLSGVSTFSFKSFDVSCENIEKYLEKLRDLKCNVSLKKIHFTGREICIDTFMETRRYLEEIGVKKIDCLKISNGFSGWPLTAFIKDFHIKNVDIERGLSEDVLRTLLHLNLNSFSYNGHVEADVLLEEDSTIPILQLTGMLPSTEDFTQILWKIQTGTIKKLVMRKNFIPHLTFTSVESDHDGPLPETRPLLVEDYSKYILHWDGGVTECRPQLFNNIEIFKCEVEDVPAVFQTKENVHKALTQYFHQVSCRKDLFLSFFDGITVLDLFHNGSLPEERPLLCVDYDSEERYHLLNEDGSISIYSYEDGMAEYMGNHDMVQRWPDIYGHTPLQKFVFAKRIEKRVNNGDFPCRDFDEFAFLFEDYEPLPHEFRGRLPERRPLVFKKTLHSGYDGDGEPEIEEDYRIVLYEDGTAIQYKFDIHCIVEVVPCPTHNLPSIMQSTERFKEIIHKAPLDEQLIYSIDLDMIREAFKGIKTLQFHAYGDLPSELPLVFKKTQVEDDDVIEERWLVLEFGDVRKCDWVDGQAMLSRGDPEHFPFMLTKDLVTRVFQGEQIVTKYGFYIDREILNQILEGCEVHAYEDSDIPLDDRLLIFKKSEIRHTCGEESNDGCDCIEEILHLCLLNCNKEVIAITWGVEEDRFLSFNDSPKSDDVPPVLKTKEMLEYFLKLSVNPSDERNIHWYGSFKDAADYFKGHMMISHNYTRPLPKTRPLVVKGLFRGHGNGYWYLREDGLLISCDERDSHVELHFSPKYNVPSAFSKFSKFS